MSKNIQDPNLKIWIKYFINKNSNLNFPSSLETNLSNIISRLKNSTKLYSSDQIYQRNNIDNQKARLIELFLLNNEISEEEYQLINYFNDKDKYDLFKSIYEKILPYFMRALIHYFNLLEQAFSAIHDNLSPDIDLSILDDKYTKPYFNIYLYFRSVSDLSAIFDQIFCTNYPVCQVNDSNNCFTPGSEINLKLRNYDSSIFHVLVRYSNNISLFQLTEKYIFLLMDNINNLRFSEFLNIKEFCNAMMETYINGIFSQLYPKGQNEILDHFFNLLDNLEIGQKDTEKKIFCENDEKEDEKGLSLYDYKYQLINTLFNLIIQIVDSIPTCKDHLISSNFFQFLFRYSIWSFTNSNFLQILIEKDFDLSNENDTIVNLITSFDEFSIDFNSSSKFSLKNVELINLMEKNKFLNIPDEAKNILLIIRKLVHCKNNSKFVSHLFTEINDFINSIKNGENLNAIYEKFNIVGSENEFIDKNSFLMTSILIYCEIIRNYEEDQIYHNFDRFKFILDDFLFERFNDEKIDHISMKVNSTFLKFTRNSLFLALLKLSHVFLPQVIDSLSNFIVNSKLSICDEIVSFLIQLISESGPVLSNFNVSLYAVPLASYGSLLHGNSPEMKRFYYLLSNLLSNFNVCNQLFENKLFVNFIFLKAYNIEFTDFIIPLLTSLNQVESEKAVICITEYLLIDSLKLLINSIEKKDEQIEKVEQPYYQIIELFYIHFYFHQMSGQIAVEKTKLIFYLDQCLTTFYSTNQIYSILHLIYSLQYYSITQEIVNEFPIENTKLNQIYQKDYPIYSKLNISENIKKILANLVFGNKIKHTINLYKSSEKNVVTIKCIEPLWMVHNILKHNQEYHEFYFEYVDFVVDNLFLNQVLLSNSIFFQNCLNFICKENSKNQEENIFSKIVSHVLIWKFPSNLFLPSLTFNKSNFLNILKNCITKESFNFPSNFAYLSILSEKNKNEGIIFGPYTNRFSFNFTLSFSFRFESVAFDENEENEEFILFNDINNKFSIRLTKQKTIQLYHKESLIFNDDSVNDFSVKEKKWHRIVISATYSKVFVAIDGKNAFPFSINVSFLSTNLAFCVCKKFEGLICDVQILNPENYSASDIIKFSTFNISKEDKIAKSIICFRPFINSEKNKNMFYDSSFEKYQYFYEGSIFTEENNVFRQLAENDLILCMLSNLNDSEILKKALKILLRLLSFENNIDSLVFPDDDSFLRFVFLLINQITLFDDDIFNLCYKLFDKIENINMKRIFVSEFLFNLNVWKSNFIKIYNRLIMNILPNIIDKANSKSNTILSVSVLSILNAIENEESNLIQSLLFEILFSFLHKYLLLSNDQNVENRADSKLLILNKIQDFLDDSYNVKENSLTLSLFDKDSSNCEMNHALIEIIKYIENGKEKTVACFILRLFGLIPTQANTTSVLEMMNSRCKNMIFKRFLTIFFSEQNDHELFDVDSNSFYKLTSYVTQNINNQNNSIDILFAVLISASQLMKQVDLSTLFVIYESISNISISNQNEPCQVFFLFWTILLLSASNDDNDDFSEKVIQSFIKNQKKESISSFVWMFYMFCINSTQYGLKKWKSFIDKLFESILSSLKTSLNHHKLMNYLAHMFIDLIITISLINDDESEVSDEAKSDTNLLYLMNLIRSDQSFKKFNSFGLSKIKKGMTCCMKEITEFCSILDEVTRITYDCDLICFLTLVICSNSEPNKFIHILTRTLSKMDLNLTFSFEFIGKLFQQLKVPNELIQEMKNTFPSFSMDDQKVSENSEPTQNSELNKNGEIKVNSDSETKSIKSNENSNNNDNDDTNKENSNNNDNDNDDANKENSKINSKENNFAYDLIRILILRFLMNLLNNVLIVSNYYVQFDFGKATLDCDTTLRNLCNSEKSKFYLRSFQIHAQQNSENQIDQERPNFVVFNSNFVPILLTNKNPLIGVIEIENEKNCDTKTSVDSSIAMENVYFIFQGTKKKCHLFYDIFKLESFMIGGLEISNQEVNFIVKHTNSSIEFFLNNGFQFIIEFTSFELTDEFKEKQPIIYNLIHSFTELSASLINEKIDQNSLNLIEITILLNFLNRRTFNLDENLPLIKEVPASQFILENNSQEEDYLNDESLKKWCIEFFKCENTINFDSISNKPVTKMNCINRCIGILTSPVSFLSICHKKVFYVDIENILRGASIILPPRVPQATIQVFNSNVLFTPISNEVGPNQKHLQNKKQKNFQNAHCIAFNVIKNNFLKTSEKVKHSNQFFVAASFSEFSGIFVYLVKMSDLCFLKSFKLNETVKFISTTSKNCFVFITNNSNKIHLIKLMSNSNELSSIEHNYFVSHSSNVAVLTTSQNFIVSIDFERKVCLTLIDSLQTVASFSIENIPKLALIANSPCFRLVALYEDENKVVSFDCNGRIVWEYNRNDSSEKITDLVLLKSKMYNNFDLFVAFIIDNIKIECRRLNEIQLLNKKKVENNQKLVINDDDLKIALNSSSDGKINHIKYDDELDFLGFIDNENNLNGLFFNYLSESK